MANVDNEYSFGRLTNKELANFNEEVGRTYAWRGSPVTLIRDELLPHSQLLPQYLFQMSGLSFYLSSVLKTKDLYGRDESRDQVMAYVKREDQAILPRVFWRGITSGSWRVAPCAYRWGPYSKGLGGHYVQETRLFEGLVSSLEEIEEVGDIAQHNGDVLYDSFIWEGDFNEKYPSKRPQWLTYPDETSVFRDGGIFYPLTHFAPGSYRVKDWDKGVNMTNWFLKFDFDKSELAGFVPDFRQLPSMTRGYHHTLLGQVSVEEFTSVLSGRPIKWVMGLDKEGRAWVDRIVFTDVDINTYGIYSEVINVGSLVNKPVERLSNVTALREGEEYVRFDDKHADITLLLYQLAPIKQYRDLKFGNIA